MKAKLAPSRQKTTGASVQLSVPAAVEQPRTAPSQAPAVAFGDSGARGAAFARRPNHAAATHGGEQVIFNVAGRTFRISTSLVREHPEGRLAKLLDEALQNGENGCARDGTRTVFVDGPPDRFCLLLDWYRYGEPCPTSSYGG